jgi:glucokinase
MLVLAGDIGGTNSRLALYDGLRLVFDRTYPSTQQASLEAASVQFLEDAREQLGAPVVPAQACLAVAGPIEGHMARITNLPWLVDAHSLQAALKIPSVRLANDFEAAAVGVSLLPADQLVPLGGGPRHTTGPMVVTGPGTGLGQAFLHWSEADRRYLVAPSEAGHADFAPRTPIEWGLAGHLADLYGRVSNERVISGPAFKDLFAYLLAEPSLRGLCTVETMRALETEEPAVVIVRQAVAGRDPLCVMAVRVFCSALGAYAGNLALTVLATGGVFIAGGIAPRIVGMLQSGPFREAFEDKGRLKPFVERVPVFVVTSREVGLLGAAALAVA